MTPPTEGIGRVESSAGTAEPSTSATTTDRHEAEDLDGHDVRPGAPQARIDAFFVLNSARADSWRRAHTLAQRWAAGTVTRAAVKAALADVVVMEEFHAVPGARVMDMLEQRMAADDAAGAAAMIRQISDAILVNRDTATTLARAADGSDA